MEGRPAVIDFLATFLPTMLLFEEDMDARQTVTAAFLRAQAKTGLGEGDGGLWLRMVLDLDPNHTGAIDVPDKHLKAEMYHRVLCYADPSVKGRSERMNLHRWKADVNWSQVCSV